MGLSDNERTNKIVFCVRELVEKSEELKKIEHSYSCKDKIARLISFCDNIWPSILGGERNSIHWLLGSSSQNDVLSDNEDLWSIAVCSSLPYVDEGEIRENGSPDLDGFNPSRSMLQIENLLVNAEKKDLSLICEIYGLIENIIYALRRYNDKFLSDKKDFSDLIANMQGTCFSILYDNRDFTNCYVANQICKILYTDRYRIKDEETYKDVVDEWLHKQNIHHDLTRAVARCGENTEWLVKQHLLLLGSDGVELKKNRVLVALRMSGRRYYYVHQHKQLFEILKKDKDLNDKDFIDNVTREIEACKKAKVDDEENSRKRYNEDHSPSMLYGWNALPKKEEPKAKKEEPKNLDKKKKSKAKNK